MTGSQSAAQQEGMTDLAGSFGGSQGPHAEEDWDEIDVLSGQREVKSQNFKHQSQESDLPSSPLLASSQGTLLSDKVAEASELLKQDSMLQNHEEERSDALTAGLSKGAVQTGFRAAGKISMTDGTSEPVTEALDALGSSGKGPDRGTEAANDKGRIMKASQFLVMAYTTTCDSSMHCITVATASFYIDLSECSTHGHAGRTPPPVPTPLPRSQPPSPLPCKCHPSFAPQLHIPA